MALPNLLGIGAQRAGTTWLDGILRTHPNVYMSRYKKEVKFFDVWYDEGLNWYESYFPDKDISESHEVIREFTALYLYSKNVPGRIKKHITDAKLMVSLRNPVDRTYSHYGLRIRDQGIQTDFRTFIEQNPEVIERGRYARYLRRYFDHFDRDQVLVVVFEHSIEDPERAHRKIGDFLDIPADLFSVPEQRQNSSYIARYPRLRAAVRRVGVALRRCGIDQAVDWAKAVGIDRMFGNAGSLPPMKDKARRYLAEQYASEIEDVESLLNRDLEVWRSKNAGEAS